jgi:2-oxoglutarate ferredoxin oxidoreductase subunit alpha
MKGNEAVAEAAIRYGVDGYFGYPITPQSEILEHLMTEDPYKKTGMVVLQAESEVASINMVYGGAACGKKVMTSSSSPGISLKQEGLSYMAGAELPCVVVNVVRGGPGLGTIQPSQADYFQSTKGGGHGDYNLIVLAPSSVQEMYDFVELGFDLAFKYRNPVMLLTDGAIGQVMEKVEITDYKPRWTDEYIKANFPWATTGKNPNQPHVIVTSLELESSRQERVNIRIQEKYKQCKANEMRYELLNCDDAEYVFVAYGSSARICLKAIELGRAKGIKVGLIRPITLWPFPKNIMMEMASKVKGMLSVEMNAGQMVEDVLLATEHKVKVAHFGRFGGIIPTPQEVLEALETKIIGG